MTNQPGLEEGGAALGKREMSELTHKSLAGEPHGCYLHTCKDREHGEEQFGEGWHTSSGSDITPFIHSQVFAGGQVQQS